MRKFTFLLFTTLLSLGLFAQNQGIVERKTNNIPSQEKTEPSVEITLIEATTTTVEVSFVPNDLCASYTFLIGTASEMDMYSSMLGTSIDSLVNQWGIDTVNNYAHTWTDQAPNTEYTVYVLPKNAEGNWTTMQTLIVTTPNAGGEGAAEVTIELSEITETSVRFIATPNDQTASFNDGLITVEYFNQIGEDSAVNVIKNNGYPQYETDDWTWLDLTPGTAYYAIAVGQNTNGEWGSASIQEFSTLNSTSIFNTEKETLSISIFPNPSNGMFTFSTLSGDNGNIAIYNMNGQKIYEQAVTSFENKIDVNQLSNGIYQVIFTSDTTNENDVIQLVISK